MQLPVMLRYASCFQSFIVAFVISLGALAPAQAANWLEKNFWLSSPGYDGYLPRCEAALPRIANRFAQKESKFWNSNLQILGFERVREIAYSPWARGTIPRRFAKRMKGDLSGAATDIVAAKAIDATINDKFARYGVR